MFDSASFSTLAFSTDSWLFDQPFVELGPHEQAHVRLVLDSMFSARTAEKVVSLSVSTGLSVREAIASVVSTAKADSEFEDDFNSAPEVIEDDFDPRVFVRSEPADGVFASSFHNAACVTRADPSVTVSADAERIHVNLQDS